MSSHLKGGHCCKYIIESQKLMLAIKGEAVLTPLPPFPLQIEAGVRAGLSS